MIRLARFASVFAASLALIALLACQKSDSGSTAAADLTTDDQKTVYAIGLALAALIVGGFGTAGFSNMQTTLILIEAPPAMRSRLMGIVTVCIGTGPLGVLAAGALARELGPRDAVLTMAILGLLATASLSLILRRR